MLQEKINFKHNYIFCKCIKIYINCIFGNWIIIPKVTQIVCKKTRLLTLENRPLCVYPFVLCVVECTRWNFILMYKICYEYINKELLLSVIHTEEFLKYLKALKDSENCISVTPPAAKEIEKMHLCRILH